jgi:8-oxo-dGTP diphosphatase
MTAPRPALTVDALVLAGTPPASVLLIQRANEPFAGAWALPGGFVDEEERVCAAARRELLEETGVEPERQELFGVYDTPGRDPRGWTVSIVYLFRLADEDPPRGGDDAGDARWFKLDQLPNLAFDHDRIIADAIAAVR